MKILFKIGLGLFAIVLIIILQTKKDDKDYIRIHIIANSNEQIDRKIKLEIKDMVNSMLIEALDSATTKSEGEKIINNSIDEINYRCNQLLRDRGLIYESTIRFGNEYCPSRKYSHTTVESGYYDTLSISLGRGEGDNWWCVMYPPLCYNGGERVKMQSRIMNWFKQIFN